MKKIIFAFFAFALAGFAALNAETVTKNVLLNKAKSTYGPDGHGGQWAVNSKIKLGNYYAGGESYLQFNLYEIDISAESIGQIDSITCKKIGNFSTPSNGEADVPSDLPAFCLEIFAGATGDAKADYDGAKLTSLGKFSGLTTKDFTDGFTLENLDINLSDEDYLTIAISIDTSLIPELASGGMGMEGLTTVRFTLTEYVVPEPSTYAAIFGMLALGFAVYRRRK